PERVRISEAPRSTLSNVWAELLAERVVAIGQAAQVPGARRERTESGGGLDGSPEQGRELLHIELLEQLDDLGKVIVRRHPDAVLGRAEPEEPQPPRQPASLEPPVLGDLVPQQRPRADTVARVTEREDPPVALEQQSLAARRDPIVHEAPGADT